MTTPLRTSTGPLEKSKPTTNVHKKEAAVMCGAKVHSNDKCIHVGTFDEIEPAFIAYYLTKRALQREAT